jgi:hypothetical protein
MKTLGMKIISAMILSILIIGLLPITAYAASPYDVVIGNSYTLQSGRTLNDDLFIMGGNATLMEGSIVNGTVILLGGNLNAAGQVNGDLVVLGGTVNLASTFAMTGDLISAGASVNRDPGAQINGEILSGESVPLLVLPGGMRITNPFGNFNPVLKIGGFFLRLFVWTLIAMVIAMFIPTHLERTSRAALSQPLIAGGLGLLTMIIAPMVLILLAITICLIPAAIIGAFILAVAWAFGLVALGLEVGKRVSVMFKQEWHPAISAGLGTLLLMIVLGGLETIIPCIGWIPKALVGFVGLGAVLLTQFGRNSSTTTPSLPDENPTEALPA